MQLASKVLAFWSSGGWDKPIPLYICRLLVYIFDFFNDGNVLHPVWRIGVLVNLVDRECDPSALVQPRNGCEAIPKRTLSLLPLIIAIPLITNI